MARNIVSKSDWLKARRELLAEEKAFTARRDALSARRRELPWVRVDEDYVFEGPNGPRSLADLFGKCSQLVVYHFMFRPDWEKGCTSCSFWADHFDGVRKHLAARDVSLVAISRAPVEKLQRFAGRLGWSFPWLSSGENDFNFDYFVSFDPERAEAGEVDYNFGSTRVPVSEMPGVSVFFKDEGGQVFHTYSCYSRGIDMLNGTYQYLDLVPKGRDEKRLSYTMEWVKLNDEYAA